MTPMLRTLFLIPAAALAAAAGCGGSDEASPPVRTTEVTMAKSYRFDPGTASNGKVQIIKDYEATA